MDKAREQRTGRRVLADQIGPPPEPFERPLICPICASAVEPVRGYKNVPALFRLARGSSHEAGCLLNPTEVIHSIAHGSHGLAHVTDDGLLRLEVPSDISSLPPWPTPIDASPAPTRDTTTVRPYLPPAITSAREDRPIPPDARLRPQRRRPLPRQASWSTTRPLEPVLLRPARLRRPLPAVRPS